MTHLTAGQALLFNMFATVIRYADKADPNNSIKLEQIEGVVLIDEVDAHLHADLQHDVLPRLLKLFPRVQFIMSSHSPLFLLGMEREYSEDGVQIFEMPTGRRITTERFGEFGRSFDRFRETRTFENEVEQRVLAAHKPLVLTEGQTDARYIKTALELLGHADLLDGLDIEEIGRGGKGGAQGGGQSHLDSIRKFWELNPDRFDRRVLLLYDCDATKKAAEFGRLWVRGIPQNQDNTVATKGIENLLPPQVSTIGVAKFTDELRKPNGYGGNTVVADFQKDRFCNHVCNERRNEDDFAQFDALLVPILREFFEAACPPKPVER